MVPLEKKFMPDDGLQFVVTHPIIAELYTF